MESGPPQLIQGVCVYSSTYIKIAYTRLNNYCISKTLLPAWLDICLLRNHMIYKEFYVQILVFSADVTTHTKTVSVLLTAICIASLLFTSSRS